MGGWGARDASEPALRVWRGSARNHEPRSRTRAVCQQRVRVEQHVAVLARLQPGEKQHVAVMRHVRLAAKRSPRWRARRAHVDALTCDAKTLDQECLR